MTIELTDPKGNTVASTTVEQTSDIKLRLSNLEVKPQYRRMKNGYALLKAVVDFAQKKGCRLVELELQEQDKVARHMFERVGFRDCIIREDDCKMRLRVRDYMSRIKAAEENRKQKVRVLS